MINSLMKWLLVASLIMFTASAKDTISFETKPQTSLYTSSYYTMSYQYSREEYDDDNKYYCANPSIPEPSTWSLFAGLCALSAAFIWRLKKRSV